MDSYDAINDLEDKPEIDIIINNVVATFHLSCHIDLRLLSMRGLNVMYRKEKGMVSMVFVKPKVTASIWSSGKVACTGCGSEEDAYHCSKYVAKQIQNLGFKVSMRKFKVVNMLATCSMPFAINVVELAKKNTEIKYEPEIHPGANLFLENLKASLKIFTTGSITVTAPSTERIQQAIEIVYELVSKHQCKKSIFH